MLGQVADAEDVVQDAWLRWARADVGEVLDPRAFLVRTTTRLAIDRLRRLKARREGYVGEWLPEPVDTARDGATRLANVEAISLALLVVLESLSPLERAVFVLREAFGFSHAEIARILDRSEPAVRQLARRSRDHVRQRRPRFDADQEAHRELTNRFLAASTSGDLTGLMGILAPDAVLVADGGGLVRAPLLPVLGAEKVARFLVAVATRPASDLTAEVSEVNGAPAVIVWSAREAVAAMVLDIVDRRISRLYLVANPAKLRNLDLPA